MIAVRGAVHHPAGSPPLTARTWPGMLSAATCCVPQLPRMHSSSPAKEGRPYRDTGVARRSTSAANRSYPPDVRVLELTPAIAVKTNDLSDDFHGDPFDRTIVATAATRNKMRSDLDIGLPAGTADADYLHRLDIALARVRENFEPGSGK
jgi:hypothetical protein